MCTREYFWGAIRLEVRISSQRPFLCRPDRRIFQRMLRRTHIHPIPSERNLRRLDTSVGCRAFSADIVNYPLFKVEILRPTNSTVAERGAYCLEGFSLEGPLLAAFLGRTLGLDRGTNCSTSERRMRLLPATVTGFSLFRRMRLAMACWDTRRIRAASA